MVRNAPKQAVIDNKAFNDGIRMIRLKGRILNLFKATMNILTEDNLKEEKYEFYGTQRSIVD